MKEEKVTIINRQRIIKLDIQLIRKIIFQIINKLNLNEKFFSVVLVSDRKIKELNKKYRNLSKPTNVLSFCFNEDDSFNPEPQYIGEIFISVETARKEVADLLNIDLNNVPTKYFYFRIYELVLHGILHLLGKTHEEMDKIKENLTIELDPFFQTTSIEPY